MAPDVNQMAAQGIAARMGGGGGGPPGMGAGPPQPGMGGPPPGGPPGMAGPQPGPPGMGGGNPAVEQGRQLLQQLTVLLMSGPDVVLALAPDIKGFIGVIREFATMGSGGGQPQGAGGPPQGPPPQGMGGPPPGPPGMGGPQG